MIIGITGGVGTGKSTILKILEQDYNAAIIMADDESRELMMPGQSCYNAVTEYFGPEILTDGPGSLINRARLAEIVFNDSEKLNALNSLNHPLVRIRIEELINQYKTQGKKLIIIETAILIQAGYLDLIDEMWLICTNLNVRIDRLVSSRGYSIEKIDSIIKSQLSDDEMKAYASFVIDNSYSFESTKLQIQEYLKNAGIDY